VIATKAYGVMKDKVVNAGGQSRYHLMHQLDASLQRLQLDHIDLYQLHGYDPLTPLDEVLSTLNDMVRSGKVRYVGLCNMAAWQIMKGLGISDKRNLARFESVQAYYTIAGRDLEREVVPLLQDQQLGLMVWSPLAGGLLSGKFNADGTGPDGSRRVSFDFPVVDKSRAFRCVDVMRTLAQRHDATVAQVALAWLLSRQHVTTVIMGAKTSAQLADNLGSAHLKLDADDLQALDEVSQLPAEYPGWMLTRQSEPRLKAPGQQ
jgi:aryl-alcohol dehydrogenase-like predicted oxidoreductase